MTQENFIKFLGTAGARFVMARQIRFSAGTFLRMLGLNLMLDPGPGTLVRCAKSRPRIDPAKLDAVLLTHAHIDHSGDLNGVLDAMTGGGFRPHGALFAPRECLEGENAVLLKYLRSHLVRIEVLEPQSDYELGPLRFSTSVRHAHAAETCGLKFDLGGRTVSFLVDTEFFPELIDSYAGADVLVMNLVRETPYPGGKVKHLCLEDARQILSAIRPRIAVITHFGMTMLKADPRRVAAQLTEELPDVEVMAASDGMRLEL